jgi:hypothetical protein
MVDRQDTLLREVEEELRREQMERLWKNYGTYAVIGAVLILFAFIGYRWMEANRIAAAEAAGAAYAHAMSDLASGKSEKAQQELAAIAAGKAVGYAQLAKLQLAGAAVKAGNTAEALKIFDELANNSSADRLFRGFAQLQAASLKIGSADFTEIQNRLNDLTVSENPWRPGALELVGVAALKAGNADEARKTFEQLVGEKNVPPSIIERVRVYMGQIAAAELAKPAPAAQDSKKDDSSAGTPATK